MQRPSLAIVGAGKVGSALAQLLKARGYEVRSISSRSILSAETLASSTGASVCPGAAEAAQQAQLVFITTPDREIAGVSAEIARQGGYRPGQVVAHTSGAHASGELAGAREAGAYALSFHPLQSFGDIRTAMENLPGSYFALEGDEAALPLARRVVSDLGGRAFDIAARDKALYHAAACIASNYLVALMHFSTGLYGSFGLGREDAFRALLPLVQGTINSISRVGSVQALTGPIARGDAGTVVGHLPALAGVGLQEERLYRLLGLYTVEVALEKGSIDKNQAGELADILKEGI